jgi:glucose/arabinose dehydrogenase
MEMKTKRNRPRLPHLFLCALILGTALQAQPPVVRGEAPQHVDDVFMPEVEGVEVETWVDGLRIPWSLVFLPNGDALVAERRGTIQRIPKGKSKPELYAELEVVHSGDCGLMGLALHPDFATHPLIYAMHCYQEGDKLFTRVVRLQHNGDTGVFKNAVYSGIPGNISHIGGRIGFGPDGMLYVGTGDTNQPDLAQHLGSLAGKILRFTPEGEIPADNPFPGSPVYTYGNRVVQGLAWDPRTGALFNSEHGPSGERGVDQRDEINRIKKGGNYGWPKVVGAPNLPIYHDPIAMWRRPAAPPGGLTFFRGDLFVATLGSQALIHIRFKEGSEDYEIAAIERWFAHDGDNGTYARLRDVVAGPDGHLYMLTSNHDGRAELRPNDDKILRLKFAAP